jgi:hypothetical protein
LRMCIVKSLVRGIFCTYLGLSDLLGWSRTRYKAAHSGVAEGPGVVCALADPAVIYQKLRKSFYKLLITRLYYGGFMLHYRQYR